MHPAEKLDASSSIVKGANRAARKYRARMSRARWGKRFADELERRCAGARAAVEGFRSAREREAENGDARPLVPDGRGGRAGELFNNINSFLCNGILSLLG